MSIPEGGATTRHPAKGEDNTEKGEAGYDSCSVDKCRVQMPTVSLPDKDGTVRPGHRFFPPPVANEINNK